MKLRIKGDSVRLRLTRGEVAVLERDGRVEDRVRFAPGRELTYRVASDPDAKTLAATYEESAIEVRIPRAAAVEWCSGDAVTLAETQANRQDGLQIVIEKDFACLKPREQEDESDNFPHPAAPAAH